MAGGQGEEDVGDGDNATPAVGAIGDRVLALVDGTVRSAGIDMLTAAAITTSIARPAIRAAAR